MMTEEQQHAADWCRDELARYEKQKPATDLDHMLIQTMQIALAVLTQPASPALKLPDDWVAVPREATSEMIESGWTYYLITKDASAKGMWGCMLAAAPTAPHTAHIETSCATGGAWVKCSERMPEVNEEVIAFIAQSHEYKGKAFPGVRYEEYWWLDGETYSYDEVSHWQPMPAAPEAE